MGEHGGIYCNKEDKRVWLPNCRRCTYGVVPPGWRTTICTYNRERIGNPAPRRSTAIRGREDELKALKNQEIRLGEETNRAYVRGHTRRGDNLAWELGKVQREIKRLKGETDGGV